MDEKFDIEMLKIKARDWCVYFADLMAITDDDEIRHDFAMKGYGALCVAVDMGAIDEDDYIMFRTLFK